MTTATGRGWKDYWVAPYPGEIPDGAYFINGGMVYLIDAETDVTELVDALEVARTVPILTYGSNACPGRLAKKFEEIAGVDVLSTIVVLPCTISGVSRAWACNKTMAGAVPHTLVSVPGATIKGHVLLLPEAYLARMDVTEGRHRGLYPAVRLLEVTATLANGYVWSDPLTYLGVGERGPLEVDGAPVFDDQMTEDEAGALIEGRRGAGQGQVAGSDELLPKFEMIEMAVPLGDVVQPPTKSFFV